MARGPDVGLDVGIDALAGAAAQAVTAQPHTHTNRARPRAAARGGDIEATATTAATDGLCDESAGIVAAGDDLSAGRCRHGERHAGQSAIARAAAVATNADGDIARPACPGARETGRDVATRVATTPADRLHQHAAREIAHGVDGAGVAGVDDVGITARTTRTAERNLGRAIPDAGAGKRSAHGDGAVATAAADGLHNQAIGKIAGREDVADHVGIDAARGAAAAARAANGHGDVTAAGSSARQRSGYVDAAIAAATAHALCDDTACAFAKREDRPVDGQVNVTARAAECAAATQAHGERAVTDGRTRNRSRHVGGAIAAAATDRLREDAVGAVADREHLSGGVRRHPAAVAATVRIAAESDADAETARAGARAGSGNVEATIAAAAADGLRNDGAGVGIQADRQAPQGIGTGGKQRCLIGHGTHPGVGRVTPEGEHVVVHGQAHFTAVARGTPVSAQAHINGCSAALRTGKTGGHVEGTVATAAADRLGEHADGLRAERHHITAGRGNDQAAMAGRSASATQADIDPDSPQLARARDAGRHIAGAIATTPTHRLGHETMRLVAIGGDRTRGAGIHPAADVAGAAIATQTDRHVGRDRTGSCDATTDVQATVATTAAHRLHQDAQ